MGNSPRRAAGLATIRISRQAQATLALAQQQYQSAAAAYQQAREAWRVERDPARKASLAQAQNAALQEAQRARAVYQEALTVAEQSTAPTPEPQHGGGRPRQRATPERTLGWTPEARAAAGERMRAQMDQRYGAGRVKVRDLQPGERPPKVPINAYIHEELARRAQARGQSAVAAEHQAAAAALRAPHEAARARLADPAVLAAADRAAARMGRFDQKQAMARLERFGEEHALAASKPGVARALGLQIGRQRAKQIAQRAGEAPNTPRAHPVRPTVRLPGGRDLGSRRRHE